MTAVRTANRCFLFFFNSLFLSSFLALSVGLTNLPDLVVALFFFPMVGSGRLRRDERKTRRPSQGLSLTLQQITLRGNRESRLSKKIPDVNFIRLLIMSAKFLSNI